MSFCLCWVYAAVWAFWGWWGLLSSCGVWAPHCSGLSCVALTLGLRAQQFGLPGSGVIVALGLSRSVARGIFPDQG